MLYCFTTGSLWKSFTKSTDTMEAKRRSPRLNPSKNDTSNNDPPNRRSADVRKRCRDEWVPPVHPIVSRNFEGDGDLQPQKKLPKQENDIDPHNTSTAEQNVRCHITSEADQSLNQDSKAISAKVGEGPVPSSQALSRFKDSEDQPATPWTDGDDDTDGDDCLPKFDLVPDEKFAEGDIVWVKFKTQPHWPAVVLRLKYRNKKLRKVTFIYVEYENDKLRYKPQTLKYLPSRFQPIAKDYQARAAAGLKGVNSEPFRQATKRVEEYILGGYLQSSNIYEFFGIELPRSWKTRTANGRNSDTASCTTSEPNILSSEADVPALKLVISSECLNRDSDVANSEEDEREDSIDTSDVTSNNIINTLSEATLKRIEERSRKEKELIQYIKGSRRVKTHLKDVLMNKKKSLYHSNFAKPQKTRREKFATITQGFGPIEDDLNLNELKEFLQKYFCKLKKRQWQIQDMNYLTDVLMPEAIIGGIEGLRKVSRNKAEEIFAWGVQYTDEEIKHLTDELIANTTDKDDRAEYQERRRRFLSNTKHELS